MLLYYDDIYGINASGKMPLLAALENIVSLSEFWMEILVTRKMAGGCSTQKFSSRENV